MMLKEKMICVTIEGWRIGKNGVATFMRSVYDDWRSNYDCKFIDYPVTKHESGGASSIRECVIEEKHRSATALRLLAGYFRELINNIKFVRVHREAFKERFIVVQEFGSETIPVALRIVFPFSRIIAIAHTHPPVYQKNGVDRVRKLIAYLCCISVSEIIFNSKACMELWYKSLNINRTRRCHVIHYGVGSADSSDPADYPEKTDNAIDFLCVGRFCEWKGQAQLVQAWKQAVNSGLKNARLIMIGEGACLDEVKRKVVSLGVSDSVFVLGGRDDAAKYFNLCDVGVLPSIEPEAFGLVLLEMMSRGKPVISSRIGGIPEVVEDRKTGWLVEAGNIEELANAICSLADAGELRSVYGEQGSTRCHTLFSLQRMLNNYRVVFEKGK